MELNTNEINPKSSELKSNLGIKSKLCSDCNKPKGKNGWCKECNAKRFQQDFPNWTSGNEFIDKFIQQKQLDAPYSSRVLEWIPYNELENIEYLDKGGFGTVYKAIWLKGPIIKWSEAEKRWNRYNEYGGDVSIKGLEVALKSLNNSSNLGEEFLKEVRH